MSEQAANKNTQKEILFSLVLLGAYICIQMVVRWLRWPLFHGHGGYGWPQPSVAEFVHLIASNCLPVAFWGSVLYFASRAFPKLLNRYVIFTLAYAAVLIIEMDLNWYALSKAHATWRDVHMFLTEPLVEHFGIQHSDIVHFAMKAGVHAVAFAVILAIGSALVRSKRLTELQLPSTVLIVASLVVLIIADSLLTSRALANEKKQWQELSSVNPLRLGAIDNLWVGMYRHNPDIDAANVAFRKQAANITASKAVVTVHNPQQQKTRDHNVLVLLIEGWNYRLVTPKTMPFLHEFANHSLVSEEHYASGNSTHYGMLGLVYGKPVTFYKGVEMPKGPGSPYIESFNKRGYQTSAFTTDITGHRHTSSYLENFNVPRKEFGLKDQWKLLDAIDVQLKQPGKHFALAYYGSTHYPYLPGDKYNAFQPVIPEDFDFSRWDLVNFRNQITNRYMNCLLELDDWLKSLLSKINLRKTIVVITGDHGEEFFEQGRLSHSSSLGYPQIRTPLIFYAPHRARAKKTRITSHHDIMPTIAEELGWSKPLLNKSQSLYKGSGKAIVAYNNHTNPAKRWAVITKDRKSTLEDNADGGLDIIELSNTLDEPVEYSSTKKSWQKNFREAALFEQEIRAAN